ncbi:Serine/threonine-protein phosphatase PP1-2 [Cladorrhinum sp. PSN259]|nr:Serine/threonine-protein phosphatase PP1-2 [Cladorrhinum sp. PSN259]
MKAVVSSWQVPPAFDLDNLVSRLLQAGRTGFERDCLPSEEEIRYLCIEARRVFLSETSLLELTAPIKICGDLRANFPALIRSFDMYGLPPESNYLFLGNYVNRGNQSIETICLLLALKIMHPGHIFLLRGRYETRDMSRLYGFYDEFSRANLHAGAWELFNECFDCLPIAATIEEKILAIPRGLSPDLYHMELIRRLWRPLEIPPYGLACDLLWATAEEDISGWSETENGVSFSFGPDIVARFVDKHDLDLICVSGHALEDGYEFYAGRKLVKLFTSPNYLGDFENAGAIMEVDETLLFTFKVSGDALKIGN